MATWQLTASDNQLKRLGFVLAYADYYFNWVSSASARCHVWACSFTSCRVNLQLNRELITMPRAGLQV